MTPASAPPLFRDPWAAACLLGLLPLVLHSLGAPLGEPVADDFDLLHYALFSPHHTWLDGGGSETFWRPLAYQGYYGLLGSLMMTRPFVTVAIQLALLALSTLLFYRVGRRFMPAPWAAFAASFPLLAESTRALICVPVHFVDVGLIAFSAVALHEAAFERLPTALAAIAAALLCKESAVATALLMPWLAPLGPGWSARRRKWVVAIGAVVVSWAAVYMIVRTRHHLELPRGLEARLGGLGAHGLERFGWAVTESVRAALSLPASKTRWDSLASAGLGLLGAGAAICYAASSPARARFGRVARLAAAGALWSAIATAPLVAVWPIWSPERVAFASVGLGAALGVLLGAAHPWLLAGMVALRLALFASSPPPPSVVTLQEPPTGAFVDFEHLVRLQRLVRGTRDSLQARYPSLPAGAAICFYYLPPLTGYAFGGSHALQTWYRDSTLRWMPFEEFDANPALPVTTFLEYYPVSERQISFIPPAAMKRYLAAVAAEQSQPVAALMDLALADSLQRGSGALLFPAYVFGERAMTLLELGRRDEAAAAARRSLAMFPGSPRALEALRSLDVPAPEHQGAAPAPTGTRR